MYDGDATTTSLAAATAGADADDGAEGLSGLWQMNGNASLNNETRRRIKKDVEEINSNLTGAAREVTAETKARDELHKSQQRGRREQSKHRFDATQTHDALKFGSEVLRGLRETMHAEIKARYAAKQQTRPSGSGSDGNGNGDSPGDSGDPEDGGNGGDGNGNGNGSITPTAIRENVLSSIRDEMEKLAADTASEIELLRKAKLRKAEIVQEGASGGKQGGGGGAAGDVAAANSSSSSNDELESKLEELRDDNKIKQRELDAERARASALEINDEKIAKETEELDRQVAELVREQKMNRDASFAIQFRAQPGEPQRYERQLPHRRSSLFSCATPTQSIFRASRRSCSKPRSAATVRRRRRRAAFSRR